MMGDSGISPQRLALEWASAAEAPLYVSLITQFTNRIRELGPLGKKEGMGPEELGHKLSVLRQAAKSVKIRTQLGKLTQVLRKEANYSAEFVEMKLAERISDAVASEVRKIEGDFRS